MADPSAKAIALATYLFEKAPITPKDHSAVRSIAWQMDHRLRLVSFWDIKPGSRILELGCGQGDCTLVLADAVGENGHVDAVDPGAPNYGSPWTLAQAQSHITNRTPLGPRISFNLSTNPIDFLYSLPLDTPPYDYIILAHCIWYFESPSTLSSIVNACIGKAKYLCVAEWSLRSSHLASQSHVQTALLLATLQAKRAVPSQGNIRTILSPTQIYSTITAVSANGTGFEAEKQQTLPTCEGMQDGYWEVSYTLRTREKKLAELEEQGVSEKELAALRAMYDAVEASVDLLEAGEGEERVKGVRSMDFWIGRFAAI